MAEFRTLGSCEVLQDGDEWYSEDTRSWEPVQSTNIGNTPEFWRLEHRNWRRPIPESSEFRSEVSLRDYFAAHAPAAPLSFISENQRDVPSVTFRSVFGDCLDGSIQEEVYSRTGAWIADDAGADLIAFMDGLDLSERDTAWIKYAEGELAKAYKDRCAALRANEFGVHAKWAYAWADAMLKQREAR